VLRGLHSWSRARAGDVWGLASVGLRFCTSKKEAKQKHSQGPVGWLLKFFMLSEMRDVHFQSHSAVELEVFM